MKCLVCLTVVAITLASCDPDTPEGLMRTPEGSGPTVVFDLFARPLPVIPLPNDAATSPDPDSPTGRRINASKVAPTGMEARARSLIDSMDGWGTFQTISIPFDAPIDLVAFLRTFRDDTQRADYDPTDDAVYVVDLATGLPAILDTGEGNFPIALDDPDRYYPNDPRGGQSNILFDTVDETIAGQDTDFDGRIDRPNLLDANGNGLGIDVADQVDDLVTFYESETNTLLLRPIVPLEERHEYAVVVTDRLVGENGEPVRSPFAYTNHVEQTRSLEPLPGLLAAHPDLYGGLDLSHVAFAWTFTTATVQSDLVAMDQGLHGEGPFAHALADFPTDVTVPEAFGTQFAFCEINQPVNKFVVPAELFMNIARRLALEVLDVATEDVDPLLASFENLDYITVMTYRTPYMIEGTPTCLRTRCDPAVDTTCPVQGEKKVCTPDDDVNSEWHINERTGELNVGEDTVSIFVAVPKERPEEGLVQPFPVAFYGHGYASSALESFGFAGNLARYGIATVGVTAAGHGLGLDSSLEDIARAIFDVDCLYPLGDSMLTDRARDLDNDGIKDPGEDFWTGYIFHTRDMLRQSVVDYQQLIRIMQGWDGTQLGTQDFDGDGQIERAGDFDADGVPDLGGPDNDYYAWGQSLGGILSMIVGAVDPAITAAAPTSGSAGLLDVGIRSRQGGVKEAVILRVMGPLILGAPVGENPDEPGTGLIDVTDSPGAATACAPGQTALWFVVPDTNETGIVEFACSDAYAPGDVVIATNLTNDEVRCAGVGQDGGPDDTRFRIGLPADIDDHLELAVYDRAAIQDDFTYGEDCRVTTGQAPKERLTDFTVEAHFQGRNFFAGDTLIAPAEGLGLRRQSPDLRRFMALAQAAVDPADPANYARHYFIDPLHFGARGAPVHDLLAIDTIGDMNVPVNTGIAFARIAGLVPFLPSASPLAAVYPEYAAAPAQEELYGGRTPNQALIDNHVLEGLARLRRFEGHDPDDPEILFDPDDLDESSDEWGAPDFADQGLPPLRLHGPTPGTEAGMSGLCLPYISNHGDHGFSLPTPNAAFDIHTYMINLLGVYFGSRGERIFYVEDPDGHTCLEDASCDFLATP